MRRLDHRNTLALFSACALALLISCGQNETASKARAAPEPTSAFATFEGKQVHYLDTGGARPALVLIHGWACDSSVWQAQLRSLATRARVIAVDLPGHGQSEIPDSGFSMDLFAKATAAVLDHAGVDRAALAGHSNGTPVIRQFYRLFPGRTRALVAVDGPLKQMLTGEIVEKMKPRLSEEKFRETVAAMIDSMPGDGLAAASRAQIKAMGLAQPHAAVFGGLQAAADPKTWEPDPIEAPVLLILAEQPSWNDEYFQFVKQLAPQAQIHVLTGVSHFIMVERPAEFDSLLLAFLEENKLLEP
jgi:pimeloyl-ACP methyl ester carboxylesterase